MWGDVWVKHTILLCAVHQPEPHTGSESSGSVPVDAANMGHRRLRGAHGHDEGGLYCVSGGLGCDPQAGDEVRQ